MRRTSTPTKKTYEGFDAAYAFFNVKLFEGELPQCLITMQRRNRTYGYFSSKRFEEMKEGRAGEALDVQEAEGRTERRRQRGTERNPRAGAAGTSQGSEQRARQTKGSTKVVALVGKEMMLEESFSDEKIEILPPGTEQEATGETGRRGQGTTDEIALNPAHFQERTDEEILSTLVHEMVHLWQFHYGRPSKNGYHNKEWASKMLSIGLIPSDTGAEGGKWTGPKVSHYIAHSGPFALAAKELIQEKGFRVPYADRMTEERQRAAQSKAASKTKYTCPLCGLNAWAKPEAKIVCGECEMELISIAF